MDRAGQQVPALPGAQEAAQRAAQVREGAAQLERAAPAGPPALPVTVVRAGTPVLAAPPERAELVAKAELVVKAAQAEPASAMSHARAGACAVAARV